MDIQPYINSSNNEDTTIQPNSCSSTSSECISVTFSELNNIPTSLQNCQLKLEPGASIAELTEAVTKCKELVLNSDQLSDERKWLVRYMVEVRLRIQELKDASDNPRIMSYTISGHHFKNHSSLNPSGKTFCDHCTGIIWSIVQSAYICSDCGYICHWKCVDKVVRICTHIIATEKGLEMSICPEIGLDAQRYRCAECKTNLSFKNLYREARLCDYFGLYFCSSCHWRDVCEIPARIVHNWDWEKRSVSRSAFQLLTITKDRPLINLEEHNKQLLSFVSELVLVRKMRGDLRIMRRYLVACQDGTKMLSRDMLSMADSPNLFSVVDLEMAKDGLLESKLSCMTEKCRTHILECKICYAHGYYCELCGNKEVIFPFDGGAFTCEKCNSCFHHACWMKMNYECPKCIRIKHRLLNRNSLVPFDIDDAEWKNDDLEE